MAVRGYFRRISVRNLDRVPKDRPLLFVANHPSAFMDPLVVAVTVRQKLFFLTRGESFQNPVSRFIYGRLNMIPVYRKSETPDEMHKNNQMFERCFKHLEKKGTILIFGEGNSKTEPRLRPIKTGAARICLGAEEANNFELGTVIVPIGINYTDPHTFRSELFLNFGQPIEMKEYEQAFKKEPWDTVGELTDRIRETLEQNTLVIAEEQHDELVVQIQTLYQNRLRQESQVDAEKPERDFLISKEIIDAVQYHEANDPQRVKKVRWMLDAYFDNLERSGLSDQQLNADRPPLQLGGSLFTLILGFPLFLWAWVGNFIPYRLTGAIANKVAQRGDFFGSVQLLSGLFVFLFWYAGIVIGGSYFIPWYFALLAISTLPFAGLFALWYAKLFSRMRSLFKVMGMFTGKSKRVTNLIAQREAILQALEDGKHDYLAAKPAEN